MNTGIAGQFGLQVQPFFQRALSAGGQNFDFRGPSVTVDSRPASPPVRTAPTAPAATNKASGSLAQQATRSGLGIGLSQLINRPAGATTSQALQVSENSARSLDISLTTRDGDRVILSLAQNSASQQTLLSSQGQGVALTASDSTVNASSRFSLSVQGQLDQGEIQAIRHLLHKAEKLASQFFAGNVSQAAEKVQDIKLDRGELAAFSLNLSATRSRQISNYQTVAASTVPSAAATPQQQLSPPPVKSAATVGTPPSVQPVAPQDVIPDALNIFQQLLQGVLALSAVASASPSASGPAISEPAPVVPLVDQASASLEQVHAHEQDQELDVEKDRQREHES